MMFTPELFEWTYSDNTTSDGYTFVPSTSNRDIRQYFLQLATKLKTFDVTINHDVPNQLHGYLNERLRKVQKQHLHLISKYMNQIERIPKLSTDASNSSLNQTILDEVQLALNAIINDLVLNLQDLKEKARFIDYLYKQNIQYENAAKFKLNEINNEQALERMLLKNNRYDHLLCSSDTLNSKNSSKLNELLRQLVKERKTNQNLRLIYVDFSYSSFQLLDMMILPSKKNTHGQKPPLPFTEKQTSPSSSLSNNEVINILLLGETGVGKSTFINAFVNYLKFNTMKQAETNKPVAVIPVSFLIATGHDFNEKLVRFGDFHGSKNEDFDHPGQSVTQHCKSYLFDLSRINGKKLRIIDTPGFGDTRGLDQDDLNMQHILEYINNITHLNAVCFLLKPNTSRLNIFFQTCLTQVLDLLGPDARQNIIFCFTNARSTFYTPGDTAPLLRTMLNSLSINDIPFKKENTFCFDNESFRYLVAIQNGIQFDQEEKHDYEMSWTTSVSESNRLLNYVHTQPNVYPSHNNWQSDKNVPIEIVQTIRPVLEAMRNILRNMILREVGSSNKYIDLCPKAIHRPTVFCTSCDRDPFPIGNFWILPDHPHVLQSKCLNCMCDANQHISIDYILSYDILNDSSYHQLNEMNDMLDRLCFVSAELAYFLVTVAHSTKEDLILVGLMRMIKEEKHICAVVQEKNHLNLRLVEELEKLTQKYDKQMKKIKSNEKNRDPQAIDELMKTIDEFPMIRKQLTAIKEKKEITMQQHQSDIPKEMDFS